MRIGEKLSLLSRRLFPAAFGSLTLVVGVGLVMYLVRGPTPAGTQQLGDVGEAPLRPALCQLAVAIEDLRGAFREGSPAAQRYLRDMVVDIAAAESLIGLQSLVEREQDEQVLGVLAQAVISRSHILQRLGDPTELQPLLERLTTETNPRLRAALIRPLGTTLEPLEGLYADLIQDPLPEVRKAVAEVVVAGERISHGNIQEFAERAIAVAVAAQAVDPEAGAEILEQVDIKTASEKAVDSVLTLLQVNNLRLRGAAAIALGTVAAIQAQGVTSALVARYRIEPTALRERAFCRLSSISDFRALFQF